MDKLVVEHKGELYIFKEGGNRSMCVFANTEVCGKSCSKSPFGKICYAAAAYRRDGNRHWVKLGGSDGCNRSG